MSDPQPCSPAFVCDLCGFSSPDLATVRAHLARVHQVEDAAELGSLEQEAGILTLRSGDDVTVVDLAQWLTEALRAQDDAGADDHTAGPGSGRPLFQGVNDGTHNGKD